MQNKEIFRFQKGGKFTCLKNDPFWRETKEKYKQKKTYLTRQRTVILSNGTILHGKQDKQDVIL